MSRVENDMYVNHRAVLNVWFLKENDRQVTALSSNEQMRHCAHCIFTIIVLLIRLSSCFVKVMPWIIVVISISSSCNETILFWNKSKLFVVHLLQHYHRQLIVVNKSRSKPERCFSVGKYCDKTVSWFSIYRNPVFRSFLSLQQLNWFGLIFDLIRTRGQLFNRTGFTKIITKVISCQ